MTTPLTCPVCDRPGVETKICPNCETDLSTLRLVVELPPTPPPRNWLLPLLSFLGLLLGLGLGLLLNRPSITPVAEVTPIPPLESPVVEAPSTPDCLGFYYRVREGDSLSGIAQKFYGNFEDSALITDANPSLTERQDLLYIGEKLLIPNLAENCGELRQ